ncbi:MAG: anthranilate phosphoribosyltransferase, partial [Carbonactinosporaceae bacterium]
ALVFRGEDGLDELTTTADSRVWLVRGGTVEETLVDPRELGIERVEPAALRGADAAYNAKVARALLAGEGGPVRDAVLLNAASALVAHDPGTGSLVEQLTSGMARAAEAVDTGRAAATLDRWIALTQQPASA